MCLWPKGSKGFLWLSFFLLWNCSKGRKGREKEQKKIPVFLMCAQLTILNWLLALKDLEPQSVLNQ